MSGACIKTDPKQFSVRLPIIEASSRRLIRQMHPPCFVPHGQDQVPLLFADVDLLFFRAGQADQKTP